MISNVRGIYIINNNESFFHQLFFPPYSIKHVDIVNCVNLVDVKPTPSRLHPLGSDPYLVMFRGLKGLFRVNPPIGVYVDKHQAWSRRYDNVLAHSSCHVLHYGTQTV